MIAVTVWAALRMSTTFVVLHDLAVGAIAVRFTLYGTGAFAAIDDHATRALIVQLFVGIVAVIGLTLALGRDERHALLEQLNNDKAALAAQQETATRHAQLMTAIIDSMADGLAVIDEGGTVAVRNDAAGRILGGHQPRRPGHQHRALRPVPPRRHAAGRRGNRLCPCHRR